MIRRSIRSLTRLARPTPFLLPFRLNSSLSTPISYDELVTRVKNWESYQPHAYNCPLCSSADTKHFHSDRLARKFARVYFRCHDCHLTFIPQSLRLSPDAERGHYGVHENDPSDPNYIRFLRKSTDHLIAHMTRTHRHTSQTTDPSAPLRVIDYGCGPGPALAAIFALYAEDAAVAAEVAAAHPDVAADEVAAVARRAQLVQYDPFFAPHVAVPADWAADASDAEDGPRDAPGAAENNLDWVSRRFRFDGVVCTEVIEHAFEPLRLLASLRSLLRPGAAAVVCTTVLERDDAFNAWGYRNDLTHVCFFKEASLRWGGARAGMDVDRVARNVFLMKRKEVDGSGDISRDT